MFVYIYLMNLLFICSRNQWRSPTAENIYKHVQGISARSAGTEPSAKIRVSEQLIDWADIVFVMEQKHKKRLREKFPQAITDKNIVVLDIPDEYQYMDEELVDMLRDSVDIYVQDI